ncbi:hypothetical protein POM88_033620 [Heracleum sosnowskyi]|uniref:F-box domain-containing protein n=1 Tax=Heracleum sosnowskyi TaxID=360622 RepID=A0AAD8HJM1_9APIA|nr:hypothetical protein POM88_033620 [Heracleum sosnowskyi]
MSKSYFHSLTNPQKWTPEEAAGETISGETNPNPLHSHLPVNPTSPEPSKPQPTGKSLPAELLLEILYRSEVKSLVRFMCVCKSWFDNPKKINFADFSKKMHVASSINGVVLLMNIDEMFGRFVVLWNPAINQWKAIKLDEKAGYDDDLERSAFGLGYDEGNDDFRIIRVVTKSTSRTEFYKNFKWAWVEVYSRNRGCWKDVDHEGELFFWPRQYHCNFIVKGAPYFIGIDVMPDSAVAFQHEILALFDPCTGFYKKVQYPEHFREMSTWAQPFEYQDSVSVMVQFTPGLLDEPMIDLYVLDDDTASWTKMYTFGPFPYGEFHVPRQSFKSGEIVIEEQLHTRDLYLYDPKASYISSLIGIEGLKPLWIQSYSHTESLVSVKRMELLGNEDKNKKTKAKKSRILAWSRKE